jgi:hypothetical protein
MCNHLHDSTSRYDAATKALTFLLLCPTCGIERVIETIEYEPRPLWPSQETARRQPQVARSARGDAGKARVASSLGKLDEGLTRGAAGEVIGNPDDLAQAHLVSPMAVTFYESAGLNAVDQQTDRSDQDGE